MQLCKQNKKNNATIKNLSLNEKETQKYISYTTGKLTKLKKFLKNQEFKKEVKLKITKIKI